VTSDYILKSISKRLFTFSLPEMYLYREDIITKWEKAVPSFRCMFCNYLVLDGVSNLTK